MKNNKKCLNCGKIFYKRYTYSVNYWKTAKFCSQRCGSIGKHNKLGKTGYKHTVDARRRIGIVSIGKKNRFWKGGTSTLQRQIINLFEFRLWRSDLLKRDDYTCQRCHTKKGRIETHHKKSFVDILKTNSINTRQDAINCSELWDINNGETLCHECHKFTDSWGGRSKKKVIITN